MSLDDRMSPDEIKELIRKNQEQLEALGGPAFPVPGPFGMGGYAGMTLRDYFAAAALQGLLWNSEVDGNSPEAHARLAYSYADAFLEARKRRPQGEAVTT